MSILLSLIKSLVFDKAQLIEEKIAINLFKLFL